MAFVNICGFEAGDPDWETFDAGSGTFSVQTSIKRTGAYALRINPTTTLTGRVRLQGLGTTGPEDAAINVATCYYRFYFYVATLPSANSEEICQVFNTTGVLKFTARITSAGKLQAYSNDGTTQLGSDGATTLSLNTWHRIELSVGTGASAAYEVKIAGTSELSGTGNLGTGNNGGFSIGKVTNRNGQSVDYYYDDVAIDNAAYPGISQCKIMIPSADGNYTTFTIGAGSGDKWEQVKGIPPDGDTTYLVSTLVIGEAYTAAMQSCAQAGIAPISINAAKAIIVTKSNTGGASNGYLRLRSNTTDSNTTVAFVGSVYTNYAKIFTTDPATSAAWTTGGLDGAEVGCVIDETTDGRRLTTCYLMVDYVPLATARSYGYIF